MLGRASMGLNSPQIPRGFQSAEQFAQAGDELKAALNQSGIKYNSIGVKGSSVNGYSAHKGTRFGAQSDIDVFIDLSEDIGLSSSKNINGFIHPQKLFKQYPAFQQWSEGTKTLGREITPGAYKPGTFNSKRIIKF